MRSYVPHKLSCVQVVMLLLILAVVNWLLQPKQNALGPLLQSMPLNQF